MFGGAPGILQFQLAYDKYLPGKPHPEILTIRGYVIQYVGAYLITTKLSIIIITHYNTIASTYN